jgi:hypothetical protein
MNFPQGLVLVVLFFALAARAPAGTPSVERMALDNETPAVIEVTPVAERWDGSGFMALRVRVENRSRAPLAWDVSFNVGLGYGGDSLVSQARLGAEPGTVSETVVFVPGAGPVAAGQRAMISVMLEGPGSRGYGASMLHGRNEQVIYTATTAALEAPLFSVVNGAPGVPTEITVVDPARWPADWRVWSPFARVVLDDREFAALDGARRAALRDWVAMGGVLDLYPSAGGGGAVEPARSHGRGWIRRMDAGLAEAATAKVKAEVSLPRSELETLSHVMGAGIAPVLRETLKPESGAFGVSLFLIAFGLLVGPINLFVFAPSGRRHRLFFTTPLISLAASAGLCGYIVMKDGFGGEGVRRGLVWLIPEANQAVVEQQQLARTGVLLGDGFELADEVMMARTDRDTSNQGFGMQNADRYLRAAGQAGGDWFASRRVQEHVLRRLAPTRARVELVGRAEGGAPMVQSSVGVPLRDFQFLDADGKLWRATEVAPGERVILTPAVDEPAAGFPGRGFFTAQGGEAEGLTPIPTLDSIRWNETEFVYAGPVVGARTQ